MSDLPPESDWSPGADDGWGNGSAWDSEGDWGQASALFSRNDDGFERVWPDDGANPRTASASSGPPGNHPLGVVEPQPIPVPTRPASRPASSVPLSVVAAPAPSAASSPAPSAAASPGSPLPAVQRTAGTPPLSTGAKSSRRARRNPDSYDSPDGYGTFDDDEEDEEAFPQPRRGRGFLGFLLVLVILAGGLLLTLQWYRSQVTPSGTQGQTVSITIPTNTSTARIGQILHENKVIGNPTLFRFYAQYKGKGGFEAGRYEFPTHASFDAALAILAKGAAVPEQNRVTIPEGLRIEQIADRVVAKLPGRTRDHFIEAATSGKIRSSFSPSGATTLEGFLFPETYTFTLEEDESTVVTRMVETFDQIADEVGLSRSQEKVGLTPYETVILASLIEREAKIDSDRAKISRVIFNRLKAETPLQIDATLVYALGGVDRVLLDDLKKDGPYNTYTRKGLPPTPIASPGKASLIAALNPEKGDWLYYVVTGTDGSHSFATTFKEHKANIRLAKERGLR